MHRFDPDTIAALAEGRLPAEEAARLEREIAADPGARAELEAHRTALAALAGASALTLTELERAGLRASIADAIGLVEPAAAAAAAPRRVPWGSLGIAAVALFGLIAVVPVVGLLNTSGGDDAGTALAPAASTTEAEDGASRSLSDETTADTDAQTGELVAEADSFDASQEAPGDDVVGFGSTTAPPRTTTTTTTVPETTTTEVADTSTSTTTTAASTSEAGSVDRLVSDLTALWEDQPPVDEIAAEAVEDDACWSTDTEWRGEDLGDRWTFEYDDGEQVVVVYFELTDDGTLGPFKVWTTSDCEHVAEVPEAP